MAIDVNALRLFQATWKPVIDAIPSLMDMADKLADLDRTLATRQREIDEANKKIAAAFDEGNLRLTEINRQMELAMQQRQEAADETARLVADREREISEAGAARKKTLASTEAKLAAIEEKLQSAERDLAEQLAKADKELAAKSATAEKVLADIEARQKAAETALESLRAKLG